MSEFKSLKSVAASAAMVLFAAVAVSAPKKDAYDIRPQDKDAKYPTAVVWSAKNDDELSAATADEVLAAFVASPDAARALLAKLRGAYLTDPVAATQIAAVSQWTMRQDPCWLCFWKPSPSAGRKIWVDALLETAEESPDAYVKTFCLDQVRWCGCKCPCVVRRVALIGVRAGDKGVKDMSDMVLSELESR